MEDVFTDFFDSVQCSPVEDSLELEELPEGSVVAPTQGFKMAQKWNQSTQTKKELRLRWANCNCLTSTFPVNPFF